MDLFSFALVFAISLIAALIDVMVGGGGLIMVPGLGILGFSLHAVIATNRLFVVFFSLVGALNYWRRKISIDLKLVLVLLAARSLGSYFGANYVLVVPASSLKLFVAGFVVVALVAIVSLERFKNRTLGFMPKGRLRLALVATLFCVLGYYEGFVGGGGGTISRLLLTLLLGVTMLEAGLTDLIMSVASSAVASAVFVSANQVDYALLVPMVAGGTLGAFLGSHLAVSKGDRWLRPLLFTVVIVLLVKLAFF